MASIKQYLRAARAVLDARRLHRAGSGLSQERLKLARLAVQLLTDCLGSESCFLVAIRLAPLIGKADQ